MSIPLNSFPGKKKDFLGSSQGVPVVHSFLMGSPTLQIFTGIYGGFTGKWEYRDPTFTGFHLVLDYQ